MSSYPDSERQFRHDLVTEMVSLMRKQRAPWQRPDRADLPAPEMPYNGIAGADRVFKSSNALVLVAAMQAHGWNDPRFITARQAEIAGWRVRPGGGTNLIFWHREAAGSAGNEQEQYRSSVIKLYNAAEVIGMPDLAIRAPQVPVDLKAFANALGGRIERAHLLSSSALARRAAGQLLGPPRKGEEWQHSLRVQLASYLFVREAGDWYRPSIESASQLPLTSKLLEAPDEFFRAARDAQAVAAKIAKLAKSVSVQPEAPPLGKAPQSTPAPVARQNFNQSPGTARSGRQGHVFLAIPPSEISAAKAAGVKWHPEFRGWYVPQGSDLGKVDKWLPRSVAAPRKDVLESFAQAMAAHGLVEPPGGPVDDNKWHYVPTADAKGNSKKGSYILCVDAVVPYGYIKNFKGTSGPWRYDGRSISPEARAAHEAQAREQAALRDRELAQQQAEIAKQTQSILRVLESVNGQDHPYLKRKGVRAHRLFQCGDERQLRSLLNLPEFKSWNDQFLVVPGQDVDDKIRTAQVISSRERGGKVFVAGAAKKGAFHLIGVNNVAELAAAPAAIFLEGYATAASVYEDLGCSIPMVVTFDAGNLVEVAKALSKRLPPTQPKIVCCDNDQFLIERALDQVREVMPDLPPVPSSGREVQVQAGDGAGLRGVHLGTAIADDRWHETDHGKYRLFIETREGAGVQKVRVDVARKGSERHVQLVLENKGRNCGEEAARILAGIAVVPAFASLDGRPTDFNDLKLREGSTQTLLHLAPRLKSLGVSVQQTSQPGRDAASVKFGQGHVKR
ncbi:ArdC-like ssDNA-binding domain-containing protein (plasmid) [Achromobacter sp. CF-sbj1-Ac2-l]|uniref:ArdC-like ssDNA-binding domain-containing protein n=1 Tax=Achromobacter TaxID=222 RepID=UPI003B9F3583